MQLTTAMSHERTDCQPLMLRVEDAARLSGLGRSKFLQMLYAGEIPGVARFGRAVRVNRRLLEAWLDERSGATPEQTF